MVETIENILKNFQEYLYEHVIRRENGKQIISYTPLQYDLIDGELDYDEEYYMRLMKNLDNMLEETGKEHVRTTHLPVTLIKNTMISRKEQYMEQISRYEYDSERKQIRVDTTSYSR